jgi:RHS repeat-associated protein
MKRYTPFRWLDRLLVLGLTSSLVLLGVPVYSAPPEKAEEKPVQVNRTIPKMAKASPAPVFSKRATEGELVRSRVFDEPLVPIGGRPERKENQALAEALTTYVKAGNPERLGPFRGFLREHPTSPWAASLLTNLGIVYRRTGYLTRALESLSQAWGMAKGMTDPRGQAVANRALSELADLLGDVGKREELSRLLAEAEGRDVGGAAGQRLVQAREALWLLKNKPAQSYACGPEAVRQLLGGRGPGEVLPAEVTGFLAGERGTSLYELRAHAEDLGVPMRMAKRVKDVELHLPALVHWKSGHFGSILEKKGNRYLVRDMDIARWVSREALNDESSGYFLVPQDKGGEGYEEVTPLEGAKVTGRGNTSGKDPNHCKPCSQKEGGDGCGAGGCPMTGYSFHAMLVGLTLADTPVGYSPPRGPDVRFTVRYVQRDSFQPQLFSYSNLGRLWTFDWLSYVEDDPANPGEMVNVYMRGGGREQFPVFNEATQSYGPERESRAVVKRISLSPIRYERHLPDGSKEVFSLSNGSMSYPRKTFMTEWYDPQGNQVSFVYDADLRLRAVVDANGQVTSLSYEQAEDPWKITKVTDPFGRSARFDYNQAGQLAKITDVIGLESEFTYGQGDFVTELKTPYGTTRFSGGEVGLNRWLEAVDPLGGKERIEYVDWERSLPDSEPLELVPGSVPYTYRDTYMNARTTFYWSKLAMARHPGDYTMAEATQWLHNYDWRLPLQALNPYAVGGIPETTKKPLENRVWYRYEDQPVWASPPSPMPSTNLGRNASPRSIARVLDDGTIQEYKYAYNAIGMTVKEVDPLGRETHYIYGTNNVPDSQPCLTSSTLCNGTGIDLLEVRQVNPEAPEGYDVVEEYSYDEEHQVLTSTDASGVTTTYTYTPDGQIESVSLPGPDGTGIATAYSHDSGGRLQGLTTPVGTTHYAYDDYGRVHTVTPPSGQTVTYDYDALDRPTRTTYAAGTHEDTEYEKLDAARYRDRLGRWTHMFYDPLRRLTTIRDQSGRTMTLEWGGRACGSCGGDRLTRFVDANGRATSWEHDDQGRTIKEVRTDGAFTEYTYETTTSRLWQTKNRRGMITSFIYYLDDQLQQKSYSDETPEVTYTYDAVSGLLRAAANGAEALSWTYDGVGRVLSETSTKNASTVSYAYSHGFRASVSLDGSPFLAYGYDDIGRLASISRGGDTLTFTYDGMSRRQSLVYPTGIVSTYDYDEESQILSITAMHGEDVVDLHSYSYDDVGNRTEKATLDYVESYSYDAASQLVSALRAGPSARRWHWTYDPAGNRTAEQIDDSVTTAVHNDMNQLLSQDPGGPLLFKGTTDEASTVTVGGQRAQSREGDRFAGQVSVPVGTTEVTVSAEDSSGNVRTNLYEVTTTGRTESYEYDLDGNLAHRVEGGHVWDYEWNAENQVTRVLKDSVEVAQFAYDPGGRRIERRADGVISSYAYDGEDIIREIASSGSTTATHLYIHGPGIDEPLAREDLEGGARVYYHADALGSITKLTDETGSVVASYQYDVWGNPETGASQDGYRFTGREWDSKVGLYFYRARYYDPKAGRFVSEDPVGLGGGPNLYAYVGSNPVGFSDPSGNFWPFVVIAAVVGGVLMASSANAPGPADPTYKSDDGGGAMAGAATAGAAAAAAAGATSAQARAAMAAAAAAARRIIAKAVAQCKKVRCKIERHGPHHTFPFRFGQKTCHIQVWCFLKGVRDSKFLELRIPFECGLMENPPTR